MSSEVINILKIMSKKAILYKEFSRRKQILNIKENSLKNLEKKYTEKKLTKKNKKNMEKYLTTWLLAIENARVYYRSISKRFPVHLIFCTLTLPSDQISTDLEIKRKLLVPLLQYITSKNYCTNYFWVSEKQKNGNIHFHIIFDKFIPRGVILNKWNLLLYNSGHILRYSEKMREFHKNGFVCRKDLLGNWDINKQLLAYHEGIKNDWQTPNTVDIRDIREVKNVFSYVMKYISKGNSENEIDGRLFGSTEKMKTLKHFTSLIDNNCNSFLFNIVDNEKVKKYYGDYFAVFEGDGVDQELKKLPVLLDFFVNFHLNNFFQLYKLSFYPFIYISLYYILC